MNVSAKIDKYGRVVIPAEMRRSLAVAPGDTLIMELDDDELRLFSRKRAIERIQNHVRAVVPEGVSLVDQLFAERRRDFENE